MHSSSVSPAILVGEQVVELLTRHAEAQKGSGEGNVAPGGDVDMSREGGEAEAQKGKNGAPGEGVGSGDAGEAEGTGGGSGGSGGEGGVENTVAGGLARGPKGSSGPGGAGLESDSAGGVEGPSGAGAGHGSKNGSGPGGAPLGMDLTELCAAVREEQSRIPANLRTVHWRHPQRDVRVALASMLRSGRVRRSLASGGEPEPGDLEAMLRLLVLNCLQVNGR